MRDFKIGVGKIQNSGWKNPTDNLATIFFLRQQQFADNLTTTSIGNVVSTSPPSSFPTAPPRNTLQPCACVDGRRVSEYSHNIFAKGGALILSPLPTEKR